MSGAPYCGHRILFKERGAAIKELKALVTGSVAPAPIPYFYLLFNPISGVRNPLPQHEAIFRFSTEHAGQIYEALKPELSDEVNPRSTTRCRLEGEGTLVLQVTAEDTAALRAAPQHVSPARQCCR